MKAWIVQRPGAIDSHPLQLVERRDPHAGPNEVRIRVSVCAVCRTDLHLAEGDLPAHASYVVPGHEVVGVVDELGEGATRFSLGDKVGIAWLRATCGTCRYCRRGDENLCIAPAFTGWDADGGYAEFAVIHEDYAYPLNGTDLPDEKLAPLLCAGIIGYRALRLCNLPASGRLGIYGFGGSAHITAQIALAGGAELHVRTRSPAARELALSLGATSVGGTFDPLPVPLDSAIVFAPAGEIVLQALSSLDSGGTVAVAGISLTDIPSMNYAEHLFRERHLRSVTANTRQDGREFLDIALGIGIAVETVAYAFEAADVALRDLAHDTFAGAAVLQIGS